MVELSLNFSELTEGTFRLTDAAAKRINELVELEGRENQSIRIKVMPGGCAGFLYEYSWVTSNFDGKKIENLGASIIISHTDMRLLDGGELDYIISLAGSKFEIKNPNATSSCGCGKSFA